VAHGNPDDALDSVRLSIRYYYDSGSDPLMCPPLALLAFILDRLGNYEPGWPPSADCRHPLHGRCRT